MLHSDLKRITDNGGKVSTYPLCVNYGSGNLVCPTDLNGRKLDRSYPKRNAVKNTTTPPHSDGA